MKFQGSKRTHLECYNCSVKNNSFVVKLAKDEEDDNIYLMPKKETNEDIGSEYHYGFGDWLVAYEEELNCYDEHGDLTDIDKVKEGVIYGLCPKCKEDAV